MWTKEPPSEPGWYWFCNADLRIGITPISEPNVMKVWRARGVFRCQSWGYGVTHDLAEACEEEYSEGIVWWSIPIEPPA